MSSREKISSFNIVSYSIRLDRGKVSFTGPETTSLASQLVWTEVRGD